MRYVLVFLVALFLFSCAKFPEEEIKKAKLEIENLYYQELPNYLPEDWDQIRNIWIKLEEVEQERDRDKALRWTYYANYKVSYILEKLEAKKRELEEKRLYELKLLKEEEEKKEKETKEEEKREDISKPPIAEKEIKEKGKRKTKSQEEIRFKIEKIYPSFYTVKEGEALDDISAYPFIYNDSQYWPLLYKYNRNQIRDPKKLHAGQILKVPRNISLDEIYKARQEAGVKNFKNLPKNAFTPEKYKKLIDELLMED